MFIEIDGKKIHYLREGNGTPLLLVHGWGGSINSLKGIFDLAKKNFDTVIVDLPGFGKSDPPSANWGVEEYRSLIINMMKKLDLVNTVFFGHSFGGSLGIYIAATQPQIINKLILCNSAFRRDKRTSEPAVTINKNLLTKLPFYNIWKAPIKRLAYTFLFKNSDLYKFPHLKTNFKRIITQDLTPYISKIKPPTLILWGENDTYTPVEYAYQLHQAIANSRLKIYPGRRHNLPILYPDDVYRDITTFIT